MIKSDPLKQRATGAGDTAANKATAEERVASEGCSQPQLCRICKSPVVYTPVGKAPVHSTCALTWGR